MATSGFDQEALINMFAQASAKQGEAVRKAVSEATLKALQGRELTMSNISGALQNVTQAATTGMAKGSLPQADVQALMEQTVSGMDAALLQAVEANRRALEQFVNQGASVSDGPLKGALDDLQKMEDMFFATLKSAAQSAGSQVQGPWTQVLEQFKMKGTSAGAQASETVEQMMSQAQTAMRESREAGLRTAQTLMNSYTALVSGVLIGMSEGLQQGTSSGTKRGGKKG